MNYKTIFEAKFIKRPNRFIAHCKIDEQEVIAHVKNTGRCKELLIIGATVYLEYAPSSTRKTDYSLIAVKKGQYLINIDSQVPNLVAFEAIQNGKIDLPNIDEEFTLVKREVKYKSSRFDLYVETVSGKKAFIEVKGVTLEDNGIVKFPDAPTMRGTKHVYELIEARKEGYEVYLLFVIQLSPVEFFTPNIEMDPGFSQALKSAKEAGVHILAYDCQVTPRSLEIANAVKINL